ncbi:dienelactone hydrolase [Salipaludibacillus neizhouensis]|uniref:Dienelactone hydrolase n=1 Tax=Salipaludibacillus neizhouensis TaxID=885475 RepID=A0A3A9KCF9_9BACI|nr:dienelactone hydrolase family protein [Salipaludibacillus neizhouensis]RKL68181.1 dienelactone hydrolase [Salipaludibacillus neizhouensis]
MAENTWAPTDYYQQLIEPPKSNHTQENCELIKKLDESLGEFAFTGDITINRVMSRSDEGDYLKEYVEVISEDHGAFPMYILTPKKDKERYPAVIALHGHGKYGQEAVLGVDEEDGEIHHQFGVSLVQKGFKVFIPEIIGFGKRRLKRDISEGNLSSCSRLGTALLLKGKTLAGKRVAEVRSLLRLIQEDPVVDSNRIGIVGFSGGALIAAYSMILAKEIQGGVLSGFPSTFQGSILDRVHCIDNYIPHMYEDADLPEWLMLIAPRPLYFECGIHDKVFPRNAAETAIREVNQHYQKYDNGSFFGFDQFDGGHEVSGEKSFEWLRRMV